MKAIFAHRNDAHKVNGVPQTIVEIVGGRITVRLSTTGKKADFKVADVTEFDGTIEFGKTDADTVVESTDTTPAPEPKPEAAPLFDGQAEDETPLDTTNLEAPADDEEAPKRKGK
jgi:hypothetical protein